MLSLRTNIPARFTGLSLRNISEEVQESEKKLSQGKRMLSAADDPSSVYRLQVYKRQMSNLSQVSNSLADAKNMVSTAIEAVSGNDSIQTTLSQIETITTYALNTSTLTSDELSNLEDEVKSLIDDIDNITESTVYNTRKLLNGNSVARITSSKPSAIKAFARGKVSSGSHLFTGIQAATNYEVQASNAPKSSKLNSLSESTVVTTGDYDATATKGAAPDGTKYEVIFTDSENYNVRLATTGQIISTGKVNSSQITLPTYGETLQITSNGTTVPDEGFKFSWTIDSGVSTISKGNRASAAGSFSSVTEPDDGPINGQFRIEYSFVNNVLSYAAFDRSGTQLGNYVSSGATFEGYDDEALEGTQFVHTATNVAVGDKFDFYFTTYSAASTAGGSFSITVGTSTGTVSWVGDDTLEDIASSIETTLGYNVEAGFENISGTQRLTVTSAGKGPANSIAIEDTSGNFAYSLGTQQVSGSGQQASLTYNGATYYSSTNNFDSLIENLNIKINDYYTGSSTVRLNVNDSSPQIQTGINQGNSIAVTLPQLSSESLGLTYLDSDGNKAYNIDLSNSFKANQTLDTIQSASTRVQLESTRLGYSSNRIDSYKNLTDELNVEIDNARSSLEDLDSVAELTKLTVNQSLQETAAAIMAQANSRPNRILTLLGVTTLA